MSHEVGDARKQSAGTAAVQHTMIEAESKIGLHGRLELRLVFVPLRHATARTHAKYECLFGQRNRCGPNETEGPVVGDGSDRTAGGIARELALASQFYELAVACAEFGQFLFIGIANDGDKHAIVGL